MVQFGSKWYADEVLEDQLAHPLDEIFDEEYIRKTLGLPARRASSLRASPAAALGIAST
jgi:hypothetical protein